MTRKSPADILADIGRALYGDHWRRPLAEALGIHERQVRRYLSGDTLTAEHQLFSTARALLSARAGQIGAAASLLDRWMALDKGAET
jgi:hypothetical protein